MGLFVAVDVETANQNVGSICAIGLVRFDHQGMVDSYYTLVDPQTDFHPMNISVHRIYPEDVVGAPTFAQIIQDLEAFIGDWPLVAHNARFDTSSLIQAYQKARHPIRPYSYFCSLALSRSLLPGMSSYRLNRVAQRFNIDLDHHQALSDARASGWIIHHLMKQFKADSLPDLLRLAHYDRFGQLGRRGFLKNTSPRAVANPTAQDLEKLDPTHPFYKKHFVLTGRFQGYTHYDLQNKIISVGGIVHDSLDLETDYLVASLNEIYKIQENRPNRLMQEAIERTHQGQDIQLLSQDHFFNIFRQFN